MLPRSFRCCVDVEIGRAYVHIDNDEQNFQVLITDTRDAGPMLMQGWATITNTYHLKEHDVVYIRGKNNGLNRLKFTLYTPIPQP